MIALKMQPIVQNNAIVKEMFLEGKNLALKYGKENVFDFSLGNPSIPTLDKFNQTIKELIDKEDSLLLHGYTNNAGFIDVRSEIAHSINKKFNTDFSFENIIMTAGAASGLNIILKSVLNPGDEVITFKPYFMEYRNYVDNYDGKIVECETDNFFLPNLEVFKKKITAKTKAVIINSPNNPTGVIYSEDMIINISHILKAKEQEFKHDIFIISDEPYRELVYENKTVPYITKYYDNTFVVYSYSKSLSIPGERIGYVVISNKMNDKENITEALTISNRILGNVNAPSLIQRAILTCNDDIVDIKIYEKNRNLLYDELTKLGFSCIKPDGAFYLFVKTPVNDIEFCKEAKKYNLLFVPGSSFSCPGYVRIAYPVQYDMIKRSLTAFRSLAKKYNLSN